MASVALYLFNAPLLRLMQLPDSLLVYALPFMSLMGRLAFPRGDQHGRWLHPAGPWQHARRDVRHRRAEFAEHHGQFPRALRLLRPAEVRRGGRRLLQRVQPHRRHRRAADPASTGASA
ncbi:MAG: hypothetical protein WDM96_06010 [Lacunisphaera sp.]